MAAHPEIVEQAIAEARENDDIVSRSLVLNMIRSQKKADEIEQAKKDLAEQSKTSGTTYLRIGDSIGYKPSESYDLLLMTLRTVKTLRAWRALRSHGCPMRWSTLGRRAVPMCS